MSLFLRSCRACGHKHNRFWTKCCLVSGCECERGPAMDVRVLERIARGEIGEVTASSWLPEDDDQQT